MAAVDGEGGEVGIAEETEGSGGRGGRLGSDIDIGDRGDSALRRGCSGFSTATGWLVCWWARSPVVEKLRGCSGDLVGDGV